MTKYVPITDYWKWYPDGKEFLAKTVYEPENKPRTTKLLDAYGVKLFAVEERNTIGFVDFSKLRRDNNGKS